MFKTLLQPKTLLLLFIAVVVMFFLSTFSNQWGVTNSKKYLNDLTPIVKKIKNNLIESKEKCPKIIKKLEQGIPEFEEKAMEIEKLKSYKLIYDCEYASNNYKNAAISLEKLINAEPQVAKWHGLIAEVYLKNGQLAASARKAHLASQLEPNNFEWKLTKARALFKLNQFDNAIKAYKSAIEVVPYEKSKELVTEYEQVLESLAETDINVYHH